MMGPAVRTGVTAAGDIQVGSLFSPHPDGQILAGLAAADEMGVLPFDPTPGDMPGTIDRVIDDFMSTGGIMVVEEADAGDDLIAVGEIQGCAGTFDDDPVGVGGEIDQRSGQGAVAVAEGIAAPGTNPQSSGKLQRASASRTGGQAIVPGRIRRCTCRCFGRRRRR
jgi:hypothetical protein